jgi:hypothetical protein
MRTVIAAVAALALAGPTPPPKHKAPIGFAARLRSNQAMVGATARDKTPKRSGGTAIGSLIAG